MPYTPSRWLAAAATVIAGAIVAIIGATALPAAAQTAGFGDVPQDAYYATPVADLHAKGVFNGTLCEDGFCPWKPIDRKTMAVWTVRVLDGQDPPPITRSRFNDVDPASFHARFIERMAELDVTTGCGDRSGFCPDRNVTRAQMAVFLSRAYYLPPGPDPGFSDVPGDAWYAADVAKLAASGITVGCSVEMFCPSRDTTRGQMATFLHRAIDQSGEDAVEVLDLGFLPIADAFVDLKNLRLPVLYCGPRESAYTPRRLDEVVAMFNGDVKRFYQEQSGYAVVGDETYGTTISFVSNGNLHPGYSDWSNLTIDSLRGEPGLDKCSIAGESKLGHKQFIVLADVSPGSKARAYAYTDPQYGTLGPIVVPTPEKWGNRLHYLGTVAHEVGHGFYGWWHPWDNYFDKTYGLELNFNPDSSMNKERYMYELMSIMSWKDYKSIRDISPDGNAYISCRQRARHEWVYSTGRDDCEILAQRPERPILDRLTPGDRLLKVSWSAPPSADRDEILDYDVRHRQEGGDWNDWQPENVSPSTTTTITGLINHSLYQVQVRAINQVGAGDWSFALSESPGPDTGRDIGPGRVILRAGDSAKGEQGQDGICSSVHCRWLHIEVAVPGEYTLACAHNGVAAIGASRGVYRSVTVSDWPSTRDCLFGYPGSEVFVIVDAERRGNSWYAGEYSNVEVWPYAEDSPRELRISWGSDASSRSECPANTECRNLSYEYIGDWPSPPYSVECWGSGQIFGPFQWSGRPHTGCYYWGDTAQVVIDGVRSNVLQWEGSVPDQPTVRATVSGTTVEASWSANDNDSPIDKWEIGDIGEVSATTTSRSWPNQSPRAYSVRIRARNAHGWSEWGTSNTVTVKSQTGPPDAPVVRATVSGTTVEASWSANDNDSPIDKWEIGDIGEVSATTTSRSWPNQSPRAYAVKVRARNAHGWSEWGTSNTVTVKSQTGPPDAPVVRATVSGTTVEASWSANDNDSPIDKWEIGDIGEVSATTTSRSWPNQSPRAYAVKVRARNAHGWSEWGTSNTVTVNGNGPGVRISWGSDASSRSDCPANTACRNLSYEYIGDWPSPPYSVECWGSGRIFGPFQWSGRPHTGCYYWGDTAQVVINGVRSNVLRREDE